MDKKKCFKCGEVKPINEFYKHPMMADGRVNKCKECNKKDVRENRKKRIDYYRNYDKQRYRSDENRREKVLSRFKEWCDMNPAGNKASQVVGNAIRGGKITRQPCEVCGDEKSEAHHPDYLKPFDVMWLCRSHHIQWHYENGPGMNADAPIEEMDMEMPS